MLVVFLLIFVVAAKMIFGYNFVAPLKEDGIKKTANFTKIFFLFIIWTALLSFNI